MQDNDKILEAAQRELDVSGLLGENLTADQVRERIVQDLSPYFEKRANLELVVSQYDLLVFEYTFWLRMRSVDWFEPALESMLDQLRAARSVNRDECFRTLAEWLPTVGDALQKAMETFHLEQDKSDERLNFLARVCFREIGEMIEGSLQPYMRLLLVMHYISRGKQRPSESVQRKAFGDVTEELLQAGYYDSLYRPKPWGVRINQWRNIAAHSSYRANLTTGMVLCEYGRAGRRKTISLKRDDLVELEKGCHDISYLHKMAFTFFSMDNLQDIIRFSPKVEVSKESLEAYFFESLYTNGFRVVSFDTDEGEMTVDLIDLESRCEDDKLGALERALSIHKMSSDAQRLVLRIRDPGSQVALVIKLK